MAWRTAEGEGAAGALAHMLLGGQRDLGGAVDGLPGAGGDRRLGVEAVVAQLAHQRRGDRPVAAQAAAGEGGGHQVAAVAFGGPAGPGALEEVQVGRRRGGAAAARGRNPSARSPRQGSATSPGPARCRPGWAFRNRVAACRRPVPTGRSADDDRRCRRSAWRDLAGFLFLVEGFCPARGRGKTAAAAKRDRYGQNPCPFSAAWRLSTRGITRRPRRSILLEPVRIERGIR